jgi:hypothetical protein
MEQIDPPTDVTAGKYNDEISARVQISFRLNQAMRWNHSGACAFPKVARI